MKTVIVICFIVTHVISLFVICNSTVGQHSAHVDTLNNDTILSDIIIVIVISDMLYCFFYSNYILYFYIQL